MQPMQHWLTVGGLVLTMAVSADAEAASRRLVGTTTSGGLKSRTVVAKVRWTPVGSGATFTAKYRCRFASGGCPARGVGRISGEVMSFRFGGDFGGTVSYRRPTGTLECRIAGSFYAADGVTLWENDQPADEAPRWVFTINCGDDVDYTGVVAVPTAP